MLYPTENKDDKLLKFYCKFCSFGESVVENNEVENKVFKNEIKLALVQQNIDPIIVHDPTFSRTKEVICPECGHQEAVFFHDIDKANSNMSLNFVCCKEECGNSWIHKTILS